uniref:Uncharacterized protein n=1 Tax=Caenorhabditis japonica TaxID=281687 RepID=K7IK58_CAEJA
MPRGGWMPGLRHDGAIQKTCRPRNVFKRVSSAFSRQCSNRKVASHLALIKSNPNKARQQASVIKEYI